MAHPATLLYDTAKNFISSDPDTKSLTNYVSYDNYFHKNNFSPSAILEMGVYKGESTKVLSKAFPRSKILALDLEIRDIDFSSYENVKYVQANQTDRATLDRLVASEFPEGIDFILEDASHVGAFSKLTFDILFPFLKSNGVYVIEDWGTGYWDTWSDGGRFQEYPLNFFDGNPPKRLPSHDFGMVGFVKSLVDMTHEWAIKANPQDVSKHMTRLKSLEFTEGICFAMKA
jgi:hypothetical protein